MVKRWMCDPEAVCQSPEGQYVDLIDFIHEETKNADLRAELDLALKAHVFVNDEWHKAERRLEEAETKLALYQRAVEPVRAVNEWMLTPKETDDELDVAMEGMERMLGAIEDCIRILGEEPAKG